MILLSVIFLGFIFSSVSKDILSELYNNNNWSIVSILNDKKSILESDNTLKEDKYMMVKQFIPINENVLDVIYDVSKYNDVISNKNVTTDFLYSDNDTLFCLQRIHNSIPFIKDRQYIFKLYKVNNDRIDWYLVDKEHFLFEKYLDNNIHTLTYGAGSWKMEEENNNRTLMYRMYVDEEVNLPLIFMRKLRINHTVDIFNDVLNNSKGEN